MYTIRDKLCARENKCLFLGYPNIMKAYKLWNPKHSECVVSRDVTFRETEMYMLNGEKTKNEGEGEGAKHEFTSFEM